MKTWTWTVALFALGAGIGSAQAQQVGTTVALAPLAGPQYTPAAGQETLQLYGTDLGYTFEHDGQLRIMFGDTLATSTFVPLFNDDAQGTLQFARCPGGHEVDRFVSQHAPANTVWWKRPGPPLTFATTSPEQLSYIEVTQAGFPLTMTQLQTPIGGFSDGRDHAFGTFNRTDFAECNPTAANAGCGEGLSCDTAFGVCDNLPFELPCLVGTTAPTPGACPEGSSCFPIGGYCRDENSSIDDGGLVGRFLSIAQTIQIGAADPGQAEHYRSTPWMTNKYNNLAVRTVNDFNPQRARGVGNDYRPADGISPKPEKVFVWGRPGFVGNQAAGREAQLYFMVADMPTVTANGDPTWAPRYFSGLDRRGMPRFSTSQADAQPLDLSGGQRDPHESFDIVDQMTVSWVPALGKWVMIYGGDLDPFISELYNPGAAHDPDGAIQIRFAEQPWGPWSKPQPLLKGGNPYAEVPAAQYAAGGLLFHPACVGESCVPGDPPDSQTRGIEPWGRLYGPNIVDCWTESRSNQVDLYWNVSTWNPYQVVLMKSRITRGR